MLSTEERLAAVRERAREIEARRRKRRGRVIAVSAVGTGLPFMPAAAAMTSTFSIARFVARVKASS
ncbi:MAG: hypothetical protein ACOX8S_12995 [Christensenellales bacterium]|jgi:hypothetical protein